ncbi:MAG: DUF3788 domain-containing protein [Clostridiaceae bacterium]
MTWQECYPRALEPSPAQIAGFIDSPLWGELCAFLESTYGVEPRVEYSTCSGAPGWNVKYKKSGRSLCTLYPDAGAFTALITVGAKEAPEAELLLPLCSEYLRSLFSRSGSLNGARWLMIRVSDERVLSDVKALIRLRVMPKA